MNRREFIGAAVGAVVAARLSVSAKAEPVRSVYYIFDGEESHWISAVSEAEARDLYRELFQEPVGPEYRYEIDEIYPLADDSRLRVVDAGPKGETLTKTAREWADEGSGLVATTAGY